MDDVIPTPSHGQVWKLKHKGYKKSDLIRIEQLVDLVSGGTYVLYWYVGIMNRYAPQIQHIETFLYEKEYVSGL